MDPPAKLDALLETVLHCLRKDNAPPLMTDEEGNLKPDPGYTPEPRPDDLTEPDKIVIFSPFPMHNMLIRKVCHHIVSPNFRIPKFYCLAPTALWD